jgi:hypothetical protein
MLHDGIAIESEQAGKFFHLRKIALQGGTHGGIGKGRFNFIALNLTLDGEAVNILEILVVAIVTHLIKDKEKDNYGAGYTYGQTQEVDERIALIPPGIPESNKKIVSYHDSKNYTGYSLLVCG